MANSLDHELLARDVSPATFLCAGCELGQLADGTRQGGKRGENKGFLKFTKQSHTVY